MFPMLLCLLSNILRCISATSSSLVYCPGLGLPIQCFLAGCHSLLFPQVFLFHLRLASNGHSIQHDFEVLWTLQHVKPGYFEPHLQCLFRHFCAALQVFQAMDMGLKSFCGSSGLAVVTLPHSVSFTSDPRAFSRAHIIL
jgi:hypothetical protein